MPSTLGKWLSNYGYAALNYIFDINLDHIHEENKKLLVKLASLMEEDEKVRRKVVEIATSNHSDLKKVKSLLELAQSYT